MDPNFYHDFYTKVESSRVHSEFCLSTYGIDLSQHGFADLGQIELMLEETGLAAEKRALDVGCGNGRTAEFISDRTGAAVDGLDSCAEAIRLARKRTAAKADRLRFMEGDINDLRLPAVAYDAVLLIDTIYFSDNYDSTIAKLAASLNAGGVIALYYSIGPALLGTEDFARSLLEPGNTPLAQALGRCGLRFRHHDVTSRERALAEKRRDFLITRRPDFEREGLGFVYENRLADATDDIAHIGRGLFRRYLYLAKAD